MRFIVSCQTVKKGFFCHVRIFPHRCLINTSEAVFPTHTLHPGWPIPAFYWLRLLFYCVRKNNAPSAVSQRALQTHGDALCCYIRPGNTPTATRPLFGQTIKCTLLLRCRSVYVCFDRLHNEQVSSMHTTDYGCFFVCVFKIN